ncbi:uncharacterized protein EI90DRAFT_3030646 [Cantharellus anzutake]|uniref:uncharacterized protein n=1 Tax=Cantharellus anzutake TaxID=1750568 RepID=UPI0019046FD8|nr:uncharacterized protein EI90DRAFT_3030646 [Cantharellus anzutake]KAF8342911.1 hypothetical protein EI90DRAFT_3030646 [Cantharellus anzutake]
MPKRTSDVIDISSDAETDERPAPAKKIARVLKDSDASSSSKPALSKKELKEMEKSAEREAELARFEEEVDSVRHFGGRGEVKIYDDCNDIRRKIKQLLTNPGFKITHWLKEIGDINNNSYQRFMKEKGPTGGAANGTYEAAYIYFETKRIMEGKKKTAKREANEAAYGFGMPREDRKRGEFCGPLPPTAFVRIVMQGHVYTTEDLKQCYISISE